MLTIGSRIDCSVGYYEEALKFLPKTVSRNEDLGCMRRCYVQASCEPSSHRSPIDHPTPSNPSSNPSPSPTPYPATERHHACIFCFCCWRPMPKWQDICYDPRALEFVLLHGPNLATGSDIWCVHWAHRADPSFAVRCSAHSGSLQPSWRSSQCANTQYSGIATGRLRRRRWGTVTSIKCHHAH